jgi:mannosyltransferase OCH1-like enzyme
MDYSNQEKWLSQIPDNDGILYSEYFKNTSPKKRSDLVRLMVLKHFGGLYIDLTVMFTESLDWLLDIKNQDVI